MSEWVTAPLFVHEYERDTVAVKTPVTRHSPSVTRWVTSR